MVAAAPASASALAQAPLGITEVVLRDGQQSLLATRMRLDDILPVCARLDAIGFWSVETWGGATFDACIRYLGEDPWERIREISRAMPNTRQQMLLRGQNILGYRHYADDLVQKFIERAVANGVAVFRIFDAMNDPRNLEAAIAAVRGQGCHAQGTLAYTVSPVHDLAGWVAMGRRLAEMGADSIAIKDMAGLLRPYDAYDLVTQLKQATALPIHMQCHATTGLAIASCLKAAEAGIDNIDTSISSMSMTYGHSPTEALVAMLEGTPRDTGLALAPLEEIAAYFREVRRKYARFEGSLRGTDSRILVAQVPGGMLSNLESQLREQQALHRLDEVLAEIPRVRQELGYIPLVTPTSQIVGTQAVMNVLTGERYKAIAKETAGVLKGEYGATPAPVDEALQARALEGTEPITCRPADLLEPEYERQHAELLAMQEEKELVFGANTDDDVLTYALFPQAGLHFLANRNNPDAFEPPPDKEQPSADAAAAAPTEGPGPLASPLAGTVIKINAAEGQAVAPDDVLLVIEAMKMETEIRAGRPGTIKSLRVGEGDAVKAGDTLLTFA